MRAGTRIEQVVGAEGGRFDLHVVPGDQPGPGILLLQEIFGVGEFLFDRAGALADLGYTVGIPDVFWRVERGISLPHDDAALQQAFGYLQKYCEVPVELSLGDLVAALAHLQTLPEVTGRTGVIGYCLGGRLAYELAAAAGPDACVSYYGSGIADQLHLAERITCPILFHFGGADPFISREEIGSVMATFATRPDVEVVIQEDAGHAFENSFAPAFSDPSATAASWPLTVTFLDRTLRR